MSKIVRRLAVLTAVTSLIAGVSLAASGAASARTAPSGTQLAASSKASFLKTRSVRIRVNGVASGLAVTADLRVGQNSCQGVMHTKASGTMQIRRIARTVYVSGDATFWKFAGITNAAAVNGKWLRSDVTNRKLASLFRLCNLAWEANNAFPKGVSYVRTAGKTVDARATVGLKPTSRPGVAYVAAQGTPSLLLITEAVGTLRYQEWGAPINVVAPPADVILN